MASGSTTLFHWNMLLKRKLATFPSDLCFRSSVQNWPLCQEGARVTDELQSWEMNLPARELVKQAPASPQAQPPPLPSFLPTHVGILCSHPSLPPPTSHPFATVPVTVVMVEPLWLLVSLLSLHEASSPLLGLGFFISSFFREQMGSDKNNRCQGNDWALSILQRQIQPKWFHETATELHTCPPLRGSQCCLMQKSSSGFMPFCVFITN